MPPSGPQRYPITQTCAIIPELRPNRRHRAYLVLIQHAATRRGPSFACVSVWSTSPADHGVQLLPLAPDYPRDVPGYVPLPQCHGHILV